MIEFEVKYNLLDDFEKQEVVDFLLSKKSSEKKQNLTDYKKKILQVSTWSDDE
jgi:hypothetical protein